MDQVKKTLLILFHNRLWIACVSILLVSIPCFISAFNEVDKSRKKRAAELTSNSNKIDKVLKTSAESDGDDKIGAHPNKQSMQQVGLRIEEGAEVAIDIWTKLYNDQKPFHVLAPEVPESIREQIGTFKFPDSLEVKSDDAIPRDVRGSYGSNIAKRMPTLSQIIGTSWDFALPKDRQPIFQTEDTVKWDFTNKVLWKKKLTEFTGVTDLENKRNIPSTPEMAAVQEDLWILEEVFKLVADVNQDIKSPDRVPIDTIEHILVGADTRKKSPGKLSKVTLVPTADAASTASSKKQDKKGGRGGRGGGGGGRDNKKQAGGRGGGGDDKKGGRGGSRGGGGGRGGGNAKKGQKGKPDPLANSPFHKRYIDREGAFVNASELKNVAQKATFTNRTYLAMVKRIPVRIALVMDERKLPEFYEAASKSPFEFEITQIRLNRHVAPKTTKAGKSGGGRGGRDKGGGGRGGGGRGGGGRGGGDRGKDKGKEGGKDGDADKSSGRKKGEEAPRDFNRPETRRDFDTRIEFIGYFKIYNPVNPKLLSEKAKKKSKRAPKNPKKKKQETPANRSAAREEGNKNS